MNIDMGTLRPQQKSSLGNVHIKQSQATPEQAAVAVDKNSETVAEDSKGIKVSISMAGKQKQAGEVNGTEKKEKGTAVEQAIAKLKEQIEQVKQQLEALQGDDSPQAEEQRKMLKEQLGVLNAALLSAIEKQVEQQQKNSK